MGMKTTNKGNRVNEQIKALLGKRRDRSIAILLGYKEREIDRYLPPEIRMDLRKNVLDQINDFYDLALDVLNSVDSDAVVLNEEYLHRIDQIHKHIVGSEVDATIS